VREVERGLLYKVRSTTAIRKEREREKKAKTYGGPPQQIGHHREVCKIHVLYVLTETEAGG